jgi:cyanate permease
VYLVDLFGTTHFSKLYGTVLLFQAIGFSIGAVLFGKVFDSMGSYMPAIQIIMAISFICIIVSVLVGHPGTDTSWCPEEA